MLFGKLSLTKQAKRLEFDLNDSRTPTRHPPDLTVVGILTIESRHFYCVHCAKVVQQRDTSLNYEVIFHADIFPHSQSCHQCNCGVVAGEEGLPDKFWKVIPNDRCLDLLLEEVEAMDSIDKTNPGIAPSFDDAITLTNWKVPDWTADDEITMTSSIPRQLAAQMQNL